MGDIDEAQYGQRIQEPYLTKDKALCILLNPRNEGHIQKVRYKKQLLSLP